MRAAVGTDYGVYFVRVVDFLYDSHRITGVWNSYRKLVSRHWHAGRSGRRLLAGTNSHDAKHFLMTRPMVTRQFHVGGHRIELRVPAQPDDILNEAVTGDSADPYWGLSLIHI